MGLEKITGRIIAEAQAEADAIIAEAKNAAEEITAQANREKEQIQAEAKKACAHKLEQLRERHSAKLADIKRCEMLAARRAAADEIIAAARTRIEQMSDTDYAEFIRAVFSAQCPDAEGEILFSERDLDRLGSDFTAQLSDKLVLSEQHCASDGFIVKSGRIEQNCTIDALFREKKAELFDIACRKE